MRASSRNELIRLMRSLEARQLSTEVLEELSTKEVFQYAILRLSKDIKRWPRRGISMIRKYLSRSIKKMMSVFDKS